jgi:hypothetical protein
VAVGLTVNAPSIAQNAAQPAANPLKLNQFMKKQRPAAKSKRPRAKQAARTGSKRAAATSRKRVAGSSRRSRTRIAGAAAPAAAAAATDWSQTNGLSQRPSQPVAAGDRIKIMPFDQFNEIDLAADAAQVASEDQLAALEAAEPSLPLSVRLEGLNDFPPMTVAPTAVAASAPELAAADRSWMLRVLFTQDESENRQAAQSRHVQHPHRRRTA